MRIDPIVALTLMLFSIIVAATSVSMSWGYALGRSALRGVTQPDVRPSSATPENLGTTNDESSSATTAETTADYSHREMVFWSESEIIEDVKQRTN